MTVQNTRPTGYAIWLIIASVVGWWAAFQLTVEKFFLLENPGEQTGCYFSAFLQCDANLGSWQGSAFGFPNPILGLTGWMAPLVVAVAVLAGARLPRWFWALFGVGITFAFGLVCWLISQSIYAPNLHTLCPWCMVTWSVTIPTFYATMLHLARNGTFGLSEKGRERAGKLIAWVPLATIVSYAIIILMAQLEGIDFIGEVLGAIF